MLKYVVIMDISIRQAQIIAHLATHPKSSISEITAQIASEATERTILRDLQPLLDAGYIQSSGSGRSVVYTNDVTGQFFVPLDAIRYTDEVPEKRVGARTDYHREIWQQWPDTLFLDQTLQSMGEQTDLYTTKIAQQSPDVQKRELERFVIELSWKSSRIEGNTYTLLDTELLIKEGIPSLKNTPAETTMILNHKTAFDFVREQSLKKSGLSVGYIDQVHRLLMEGLLEDIELRKQAVGITGSTYRPLDNQFQIKEALEELVGTIKQQSSVYDQALTALLGISYIQPFVDGNKRTARLVANGLLLAGGAAPLSYRNVDEVLYRASLLVFYEQLSIVPMRELFIEQYQFATEHYS